MVVRLSALRTDRLCPQEIQLVLISVRGWVDSRTIVRPEELYHWKIPMTTSGIEPATCEHGIKNYSQLHNLHNYTIYTKVPEIRVWWMIHEFTTDDNETGIWMGWHVKWCKNIRNHYDADVLAGGETHNASGMREKRSSSRLKHSDVKGSVTCETHPLWYKYHAT
jgi:hypothetical protein